MIPARGIRKIEEHKRPFKPLWGRGLCRRAHGELKNIVAFGRHQETHRPSPRRRGTRHHHQRQGDNVESTAIVRHNGESHAQDVEEPHTGIDGCNEHALINATAIEYHDNAAAETEHRFPPRGRGPPRSCQPRDHRENHGDGGPGDMRNTAAPRAWTIITARETTVETGTTPATTRCPPPLVARLHLRGRSAAFAQAAGGHLGRPCLLDIGARMLENRELARAMEFDGEERSCEFHGNKV